ncbi:MAG: ATP-dependent 6-phosphofructokinase [Gemmatimonadota bacterium]|nr:ATP-dependent 6-phosphofructokinase [Gemmatimonadota bacterium]MDE3128467.1 ATP-dependent 6-phosphofructokinase [Gemmatimonadota bacterium]MDE3173656.1 ATP-dependent 6-phosphofructokinase [Gemmatimonadota bacterium]MDE3216293.1 ATP-dependent 6-phosphofructokinase [Gemmatimonadota bacterium]
MRIAISTGGGDAPGLNAVIRAATLAAIHRGWEVLGVRRGYYGLLGEDEVVTLNADTVRGIAHLGGTILRTTNRGNPFRWPVPQPDGSVLEIDRSDELIESARQMGIEAVVTIGGDGSMHLARKLHDKGMRIVGVPKTIDNDVPGTASTFGHDTAVSTALDAIDKLHTTAESHDRVIVTEVMGRHAGFIALHAGLAGTADVILIPEIPYDIERVCDKIRERDRAGRHFSIVVAAEGAFPRGGSPHFVETAAAGVAARLGGVGEAVAHAIEARTGKETRSLVLGHLQRGGQPTGYDRLLATRFGGAAVAAVAAGKWGHMVALRPPHIVAVPIAEALAAPRRVELDHDVVQTARATGICFGD